MKTLAVKSIALICIAFFTLTGTTSCKKEAVSTVAPQRIIDPNLVGTWKNIISVISANGIDDRTEETFKADGTGIERDFRTNRGVVENERITTFEWFVKSEGVLHIKVSNGEEGDVPYRFTNTANTEMDLDLPSGQTLSFRRIN